MASLDGAEGEGREVHRLNRTVARGYQILTSFRCHTRDVFNTSSQF